MRQNAFATGASPRPRWREEKLAGLHKSPSWIWGGIGWGKGGKEETGGEGRGMGGRDRKEGKARVGREGMRRENQISEQKC